MHAVQFLNTPPMPPPPPPPKKKKKKKNTNIFLVENPESAPDIKCPTGLIFCYLQMKF